MYLVGRRRSPHVHDYRDFLERNRVPFRWIDVDRNPLIRYLDASATLRQTSLPFFLLRVRVTPREGSHIPLIIPRCGPGSACPKG